jgi:L,D-transpeptidase ErfK/SrfK
MTLRNVCFLICLLPCLCLSSLSYAATYKTQGDVIGAVGHYTVRKKDNLSFIARQFDIGIVELLAANPGVTPQNLKAGAKLTLPTMHVLPPVHGGIVLNLSELRLFYFAENGTVMTFPIGIGRDGWQTPTGETSVILKRKDPVWIPPDSIREEEPNLPDIVPAGPNNPLGQYALNIGLPGIRIHGTNRPYSVGKRSSHGCIRLYPEDIEALFNVVTVGTPVTVIDAPYKLGWQDNTFWLEVTPTQSQDDDIAAYRQPQPVDASVIHNIVISIAKDTAAQIDLTAIDKAVADHSGIPVAIVGKVGLYNLLKKAF